MLHIYGFVILLLLTMLFLTHKMVNFLFKKSVNDIDKDNRYLYVKAIVILKL